MKFLSPILNTLLKFHTKLKFKSITELFQINSEHSVLCQL